MSVRALALLAALATGAAGAAERHVDPAHPNASERGEGAAAQPYRTLVQAMAALRPGDTLVIASGVYRESLEFPSAHWASAAAPTTLRAAPGAVVVIKGSDVVTGWERPRGDLYVKRGAAAAREMVPQGNRVLANLIAWNGGAGIVIPAGLASVSNCNLLVAGAEGPPSFSEGWGSRERPVRRGLAAWRAASGQDARSTAASLELPQDILAALEARRVDVDWSALAAIAARQSACPVSLDLPGRRSDGAPGPAR